MNYYRVGGCVRDHLLGLPVNDIDWVVTGATPAKMLAAGYKPIGRDFPVFLHPDTHQEYALARSERKSGTGYRGFEVNTDPAITIEQDLLRRDLTINAIAEDEQGNIIVPQLNRALLGELASTTGGRYSDIRLDDSDINYLLAAEPWALVHPDDVARIREQLAHEFQLQPPSDRPPALRRLQPLRLALRWLPPVRRALAEFPGA